MPQTRIAVDALGVVTISLVAVLSLFGLFCIIYTLYFRFRVRRSGFVQLGYFNGPWIIRIVLVLIGIWWGVGEIIRLSFMRRRFVIFSSLGQKWQEDICRYYILSNLGFAEPCLFVTMGFLLRASLQWRDSGTLHRRWNFRTTGYILLCCLPVFVLDLIFVVVGPKFDEDKRKVLRLPHSFTSTHLHHQSDEEQRVSTAICTYPLLCTILHGTFAVLLTTYLLLLGRRVVSSVINKGLQRRVYVLIFLVSSFFPSRIILLGFSVLARADFLVEALAFSGFLVLLLCVVVGMFMLVYLPVSDSLALRRGLLLGSTMSGVGGGDPDRVSRSLEDCVALIGPTTSSNYGIDASAPTNTATTTTTSSTGRNSDASTKRGSISFRTMIREEACGTVGVFEEEMANTYSLGSNTNLNTNQNLISSSGSPPGTTTITPFGIG